VRVGVDSRDESKLHKPHHDSPAGRASSGHCFWAPCIFWSRYLSSDCVHRSRPRSAAHAHRFDSQCACWARHYGTRVILGRVWICRRTSFSVRVDRNFISDWTSVCRYAGGSREQMRGCFSWITRRCQCRAFLRERSVPMPHCRLVRRIAMIRTNIYCCQRKRVQHGPAERSCCQGFTATRTRKRACLLVCPVLVVAPTPDVTQA